MRLSTTLFVCLTFTLQSFGQSGDRLFASRDGVIEAYDFDNAVMLNGSPIAMPGKIQDVEASAGKGAIFSLGDDGSVMRIDTATLSHFSAPTRLPLGPTELACDSLRSRVYSVDNSMILRSLDAYSLSGTTRQQFASGFRFSRIKLTPDSTRMFLIDGETHGLYEQNPASSSPNPQWTGKIDSTSMWRITPDGNTLVHIRSPASQELVTITIHDLRMNGCPIIASQTHWMPNMGWITGMALDTADPTRLFIATRTGGVEEYDLTNLALNGVQLLATYGQTVLDICWSDSANLYVLSPSKIERFAAGISPNGVMYLQTDKKRDHLIAVASTPSPDDLISRHRPWFVGLLYAVGKRGWGLPSGWNLAPSQVPGEECDPATLQAAAKQAIQWIDSLKGKPGSLSTIQVAQFLATAKGSDRVQVERFLDIVFLELDID